MKHTPLKRKTRLRSRRTLNNASIRQDYIEKTLGFIREIIKLEKGDRCQICGKPQEALPFGLSAFHILARSQAPRLVLYRPNILLACWGKGDNNSYCHNIWHSANKSETKYKNLVKKIELVIGKDLEDYKADLKLADKTLPRLSFFQLESYYYAYKCEFERLKVTNTPYQVLKTPYKEIPKLTTENTKEIVDKIRES